MNKFSTLFNKVNGWKIIRQYMYAHVLIYALFMTLINGFSKKSLEILRLGVTNKLLKRMRKKYKRDIIEYKNKLKNNLEHISSNKIWMYWGQGIDNAPELVQKCYNSIKDNIANKEVIMLDDSTYKEYVTFPEYIQKKIDLGIITKTHFSDLLRLELLIKYGGTWIDSTVYCSGKNYEEFMLEDDLFFFQCLKPGLDGHATCISSWFLTAKTNNNILLLTRELLYKYWSNHNKMIDYFLLHDFMQIVLETNQNEWKKVIPVDNATEHILLLNFNEKYNEGIWNYVKNQRAFHKLSYKIKIDNQRKDSYYNMILNR